MDDFEDYIIKINQKEPDDAVKQVERENEQEEENTEELVITVSERLENEMP